MLAPIRTTAFRAAKLLPRSVTTSSSNPQRTQNAASYTVLWAGVAAVGITYFLAYGDENAKAKTIKHNPPRDALKFNN